MQLGLRCGVKLTLLLLTLLMKVFMLLLDPLDVLFEMRLMARFQGPWPS